jgi:hypothetical protein
MNGILTCKNRGLSPVVLLFSYKTASRLLAVFFVLAAFLFPQNEARAAVAFGSAGAVVAGTTSLAVPHPAGIVAGDLLVLVVGNKFSPTHSPATPVGWTLVTNGQGSGGLGNTATNDAGPVYSTVFVKQALGGEAGNLTVTLTAGANASMGRMFRYTKAAGTIWDYAATNGSDILAGVAWSVTGAADPGIISGDVLVVASAINGNVVTSWATESVSATGATFGVHTERQDSSTNNGRDMALVVSDHTVTAGVATAAPVFTMTGTGTPSANSPTGASVILRIREVVPVVTTLATGIDPAAATIAPGSAATDVDLFTLQTASGTEAITSVTVNLSTSSGIGRLAITDSVGTELGFTTTPVTGSNIITVTGMSATTTLTTFKVRVTPLSHALMPVIPGANYAITAPVTAWAGPNTHAGSDTNPNALTIDNFSPVSATSVSGLTGNAQVTLNWTTSASPDVSRSVVLRWTASMAGVEVPTEGTDYVNGNAIGTATVVCVRTADAASTAVSGADGAGTGGCSATPLVNGQTYTYKVFQKDSNGNYDAGVDVGTFYPPYPTLTCMASSFTGADNSAPDSINWDVQNVSGTFTPVVFGNRLRITDITGNVATRATNKNLFTFGNNVVIVEFDYWAYGGTGADGVAVIFSDPNTPTTGANNPPTAGGFGGSLGYANRDTAGVCNIPGFTGGWIGVGLDEYGNYSNPTECRNGGPGPIVNAVSVRGSGSGATSPSASNYAYVAGTAALGVNGLSSGTTATAYRYRITLDSVTDPAKMMVAVEQDKTGTGYLPLISPYDLKPLITAGTQAPLPSQLQVTFTGTTGTSTNYHEIDNLSICSSLVVSSLNHVAISAPASATAFVDVPVIIAPHDVAHAQLSNGSTINLSTSTGLGDWAIGSGTGILTPGAANSGLATYTFGPGEVSVTLNFSYQTAGAVTINVVDAGGGDLLLNTPAGEKENTINFTMSSFVFTDSACVHNIAFSAPGQTCSILGWSPQVAGQDSPNAYITAVNATGIPTRLHQTQARTRNMRFGLSCHNPAANAGKQATFGAVTLPLCQPNGVTPTAWSATFAASFPGGIPSAGPYVFNYADVGQVELWMQNSAAPAQMGASGAFVVKPGGLVLSGIKQTAAPGLPNPAAANAAGAKFVKAGEMFSVTVTATTCAPVSATCTVAGAAVPNYGNETTPESVKLTPVLVAPLGGSNPAISGAFGVFGAAHPSGLPTGVAGVAHGTAFTWSEVGIVDLTPSVGDGDYLGMGDVTGTPSGNVGRFFPDHFDTEVVATATLPMPCPANLTCPALYDGLVYSGQPFSVQVIARNLAGGTTANYDGVLGFSKPATLTAWDALGGAAQNPGSGVLANSAIIAASFNGGAATTATPVYTLADVLTAPTDIFVRAVDEDNVTSLLAVPGASIEGGVKVVSGRVKIGNAYGSQLLQLSMSATVQYYDGTSWLTSLTDSVTSLTLALSNYQCKTGCAWTTTPTPASGQAIAGILSFQLSQPSGGGTGSLDVSISAPDYLLAGSNGAAVNPSKAGRATFGIYKGSEEFIYLREVY